MLFYYANCLLDFKELPLRKSLWQVYIAAEFYAMSYGPYLKYFLRACNVEGAN